MCHRVFRDEWVAYCVGVSIAAGIGSFAPAEFVGPVVIGAILYIGELRHPCLSGYH
jgi:hypothetical protein